MSDPLFLNPSKSYFGKFGGLEIVIGGIFLILIIGILGWFGESIFQNFIHQNFPFQAAIVQVLTPELEKEESSKIQPAEQKEEKEEELIPEEPNEESFPQVPLPAKPKINLIEAQDQIDEIAEKIDILGQEIISLVEEAEPIFEEISAPETEEEIIKEGEEKETEETEETEKEEESEDLEEEEIGQKIGQEVGQDICEIILGIQPVKNTVIINEIAWMGSISSANDEWIELKNISSERIDLSDWQILDKDNQIKIILSGTVLEQGFYLLERTDDDSVPNILADFIYKGTLNDKNEVLYLFDENCQLQDKAEANPVWPAGDKSKRRTMERGEGFTWHTYQGSGQNGLFGTPKKENSRPPIFPSNGGGVPSPPEPAGLVFCSQESLSEPTYQPVILNEIAWMGTLTDWRDEWLELKNISENNVSLEGWQILDKDEEIKIIFSGGDRVSGNGFYLLERTDDNSVPNIPADKIYTGSLEDQDESLRLFDQSCNLIDEVLADLDWPGGSKEERKSMERTDGLIWQTYFGEGEVDIMGTPKKENSQPEEVKDEIPPLVAFDDIFSLKINPEFTISWQGQDPIGTTTSSGIDVFYLRHNILEAASPSNLDAIQYQDIYDNWQDWQGEEILEIGKDQNQLKIRGENKEIYYFQIKAKDKAGNESEWAETTIEINDLPVVINEIAWMGTEISHDNEWIELYNNCNSPINLENWQLLAQDGTPKINLSGTVPEKGYYLLERTDDNTLPEISADQIYTGALGNAGENLELYNLDNYLIDRVICKEDEEGNCEEWLAGENETKQTMERKNPLLSGEDAENWGKSQNSGGTPKFQNSQCTL